MYHSEFEEDLVNRINSNEHRKEGIKDKKGIFFIQLYSVIIFRLNILIE
jgi:hypothetical protein